MLGSEGANHVALGVESFELHGADRPRWIRDGKRKPDGRVTRNRRQLTLLPSIQLDEQPVDSGV